MKKALSVFLSLLLLFVSFNLSSAEDNLNISAEAAILIDADTGQILYEKNSHEQLYPASTTKILTGIIAIEKGNPEDIIIIDEDVPKYTDGTHIALEPGEKLTLRDLTNALLIESANDAAVAIAIHISGSVENFADLMNEKAKEIGALNTHFENPNGLPNENHLTTAYDLAMIAKYAMKNKDFRDIVKNYTYIIPQTNKKDEARYLKSSNRLLYSTRKIEVDNKIIPIKYEGVNGVKSGYTKAAQQCLVSSATRGGQNLICVVLKAQGTNVYVDTHKLLNYGFDNFEKINLTYKNEFIKNIDVLQGEDNYITAIIKNTTYATIPKGKEAFIERKIDIPENIKAPIKKGQVLGKITFLLNGKSIGSTEIISATDINEKAIFVVKSQNSKSLYNKLWIILIPILIISWRGFYVHKRKKYKKRKQTEYLKF